jgi:hypothetical protein
MEKKIAYLVLAHNDPVHLGRLLNAIDYKSDSFVHIDRKSELGPFANQALPASTRFVQNRREVHWADISMVDALVALMREALRNSDQYSHLVLLSGSDYPLRPARDIYGYFTSRPDHQFMKYIDMRDSGRIYMRNIKRRWFKRPFWIGPSRVWNLPDKVIRRAGNYLHIPNQWRDDLIVPYYGSTWTALTPECCRHILDFHDANPWYYGMNRPTFAPDEHYFHTIVGNSAFAYQTDGVQPFEGRGLWRLANFHHIHPSLAKWYTLDDWEEVAAADAYFVRKLNSESSGSLIEAIDERLLGIGTQA